MLTHERFQHPVGQGFFHSARVEIYGATFDYIYDCGSEDKKALDREVGIFSDREKGNVNALFISHLDRDHVNGLDNLLPKLSVHTVVLPHLNVSERILLAAKALNDSDLPGDYVHFLGNQATWLAARNVKRIIFITGDEHTVPPELPDVAPIRPPVEPSKDHKDDDSVEDKPQLDLDQNALRQRREYAVRLVGASNTEIFVLPDTVPIPLSDGQRILNWCFLPFCHPDEELRDEFRKEFRERFQGDIGLSLTKSFPLPPDDDITDLLYQILQQRSLRNQLAKLYRSVFHDRNLTSLSLYSGPIRANSGHYKLRERRPPARKAGTYLETEIGWLGTGDADLKDNERRKVFLQHFEPVMSYVATEALPHHGSRNNFHEEILPSNASLFVVGVTTRERYGHPHPEVVRALDRRELPLKKVTDDQDSYAVESFELLSK